VDRIGDAGSGEMAAIAMVTIQSISMTFRLRKLPAYRCLRCPGAPAAISGKR
jgi:hypothetical protein